MFSNSCVNAGYLTKCREIYRVTSNSTKVDTRSNASDAQRHGNNRDLAFSLKRPCQAVNEEPSLRADVSYFLCCTRKWGAAVHRLRKTSLPPPPPPLLRRLRAVSVLLENPPNTSRVRAENPRDARAARGFSSKRETARSLPPEGRGWELYTGY